MGKVPWRTRSGGCRKKPYDQLIQQAENLNNILFNGGDDNNVRERLFLLLPNGKFQWFSGQTEVTKWSSILIQHNIITVYTAAGGMSTPTNTTHGDGADGTVNYDLHRMYSKSPRQFLKQNMGDIKLLKSDYLLSGMVEATRKRHNRLIISIFVKIMTDIQKRYNYSDSTKYLKTLECTQDFITIHCYLFYSDKNEEHNELNISDLCRNLHTTTNNNNTNNTCPTFDLGICKSIGDTHNNIDLKEKYLLVALRLPVKRTDPMGALFAEDESVKLEVSEALAEHGLK